MILHLVRLPVKMKIFANQNQTSKSMMKIKKHLKIQMNQKPMKMEAKTEIMVGMANFTLISTQKYQILISFINSNKTSQNIVITAFWNHARNTTINLRGKMD